MAILYDVGTSPMCTEMIGLVVFPASICGVRNAPGSSPGGEMICSEKNVFDNRWQLNMQ